MTDLHYTACCHILFSKNKDIIFKCKGRSEVVSAGNIILTNDINRFFSKTNILDIPLSHRVVHEVINFLSRENIYRLTHNKVPDFFTAKCGAASILAETQILTNCEISQKNEYAKLVAHVLVLLSEFFNRTNLLSFLYKQ